jgi:hypothetical protein
MLSPHTTTNCEILNVIVSRILSSANYATRRNIREAYIRRLSLHNLVSILPILTVPRHMVGANSVP